MSGLIVVDMHARFTGSSDPIVRQNVRTLISRYRTEGKPIFIVEYGSGDTHQDLIGSLFNYKEVYWVRKNTDDGSKQVHRLIERCMPDLDNLIVCGVNASFCVYSTCCGLINLGYKVVVPEDATCNGTDQKGPEYDHYGPRGLAPLHQVATYEPTLKHKTMLEILATDDLSQVINL